MTDPGENKASPAKRLAVVAIILAGAAVTAHVTLSGANIGALICAAVTVGLIGGLYQDDENKR